MNNKQKILHLLESQKDRSEWVWTYNLGLNPLSSFGPAIKTLETEGMIEVIRGDRDASRRGWGIKIRLK